MADYIKTGDLVVCIEHGKWKHRGLEFDGPKTGEMLIVEDTKRFGKQIGLWFSRWPNFHYNEIFFKKVPPITDEQERKDAALLGAGLEPV